MSGTVRGGSPSKDGHSFLNWGELEPKFALFINIVPCSVLQIATLLLPLETKLLMVIRLHYKFHNRYQLPQDFQTPHYHSYLWQFDYSLVLNCDRIL